jgi:hypothetical protein
MKKCKNCENNISNRNVFCNNKCQQNYQNNQKIKIWLNGENFIRNDGLLIPSWIRNYLFQESNNKCIQCGWGQMNVFTKKIPLEVDHIDGDSKNNIRENLRLLCPNCHSLTETYKNNGNRKSSRVKRKN